MHTLHKAKAVASTYCTKVYTLHHTKQLVPAEYLVSHTHPLLSAGRAGGLIPVPHPATVGAGWGVRPSQGLTSMKLLARQRCGKTPALPQNPHLTRAGQ